MIRLAVEPEAMRAAILAANEVHLLREKLFIGLARDHGEAAFALWSLKEEATKARDRVGSARVNGLTMKTKRKEAAREVFRPFCEALDLYLPGRGKVTPCTMAQIIRAILGIGVDDEQSRVLSTRLLLDRAARRWAQRNKKSMPKSDGRGPMAKPVGSSWLDIVVKTALVSEKGYPWVRRRLTPSLMIDGDPGIIKVEWVVNGVAEAIGIDGVKAVFAALQARERNGS